MKDRIILHLLDHWGHIQRGEWPEALTQDGIAGVVGISRSHVAVTLPDLIEEGLVASSTERVTGRPRRVKVYALSYLGGQRAGGLAQQILRTTITAVDDSGEWDIPVDGLIQVHRVHMLVVIRVLDGDNRVDLRKAAELVEPTGPPARAGPPEAEEEPFEEIEAEDVAVVVDEVVDEVVEEPPSPVPEAAGMTPPPVPATVPAPAPVPASAPASAPDVLRPRWDSTSWGAPQAQQADQPWAQQGHYPPQPYFWSPLRYGSGQRPTHAYVAATLVLGFLSLVSAVAFFGMQPVICAALWVPLTIVGLLLTTLGFRSMWALGGKREAWALAALSANMFLVVTMICFAAFGPEVAIDLGWVGLLLGLPSLILMAGTGHSVARRGAFALVIGPVMVIAALTMAMLDPGGLGRTGAMPLLIVAVGTCWTFVGWLMTRDLEDVATMPMAVAGGFIGLAIAVVGVVTSLGSQGDLSATVVVTVGLWMGASAYMAAISLIPDLEHLRPDTRTAYSALAVAGAAALLLAAVIFFMGGLYVVGVMEAVIAVALMAMVVPDLQKAGKGGFIVTTLGCLLAVSSVFVFSIGL